MRRSLSLLLTVLSLLLFGTADAAVLQGISVWKFRATQEERGTEAALKFHIEEWTAEAKKRGLSLRDYTEKVLVPYYASHPLPAIIDWKGEMRNTDGHHRVTGLRKLAQMTGVKIAVSVELLQDYRGWTEAAYAHHFLTVLKKGQFTEEHEKLSEVERIRLMPTYSKIRDNAMRSSLEVAFDSIGIEGNMMQDYVEFRLIRKLVKGGILDELADKGIIARGLKALPKGKGLDPRVIDVVAKRVSTPDMQRYLLSESRDQAGRARLQKALGALKTR